MVTATAQSVSVSTAVLQGRTIPIRAVTIPVPIPDVLV